MTPRNVLSVIFSLIGLFLPITVFLIDGMDGRFFGLVNGYGRVAMIMLFSFVVSFGIGTVGSLVTKDGTKSLIEAIGSAVVSNETNGGAASKDAHSSDSSHAA